MQRLSARLIRIFPIAIVVLSVLLPGEMSLGQGLPGLDKRSGLTAAKPDVPQVGARMLAGQTAVTPGGTVELAIEFDIPDGWHIYWKNRGEGGLETSFAWNLPEGWSIGPVRFPPPERHVDEVDVHTFILEGRPIVLATVTAPADAETGREVEIGVDASWLICKTMCYPGNKWLAVRLPVVASAEEVKPAHEDVFDDARRKLPVAGDEAKYLDSVRAVASVDRIKPGETFSVAVVIDVADDHHINSHQPLTEGLIATDVFHERPTGVEVGRAKFRPGNVEEHFGEKLSVYRDEVAVVLPVRADGRIEAKQVHFSGIVRYQACNDKTGQCYPPMAAEWSLRLPVAAEGETVTATHAELFESAAASSSQADAPASAGGGFTLDSTVSATLVRQEHSFVIWLGLALLAGLILNVTPCVLPVISIKVLSFVQQASESPAQVFKLGLAFSLGMMLVFNVLAVMATALGLVWGQHFQSPEFTVAMAAIVFAFGLSMFGVFTLGVPAGMGELAAKAESEGYAGSIAKGALATVMGTPCLGPFLGPVLVWASAQPAAIVFIVFNTIGVGMALPYVLLTANPRWLRFVPKAGPWLTTFKQAMAFLLMGTVVYLLFILEGQLGGSAVIWTLAFLTAVAVACWMLGRFITYNTPGGTRAVWMVIALAIAAGAGFVTFGRGIDWSGQAAMGAVGGAPTTQPGHDADSEKLPWVPFSMEKLTELTAAGTPVMLDITARWCPNCHYNSAFVFNTPEVAAAIENHGVVPMLADWTGRGKVIGDLIDKLAPGASIPLAAVFPAGRADEPIVMLGVVTKQQVIDNLAKAR